MLDRTLQRTILEHLAKMYPDGTYTLAADLGRPDDDRALQVNAMYLAEHKLIQSGMARSISLHGHGAFEVVDQAVITAHGLDFLEDDGGLTAVLGVVTVRLDTSTLRAMLDARIEASSVPAQEKSRLRQALNSMGSELWAEATKRLASEALDRTPDALALVRTLLDPLL